MLKFIGSVLLMGVAMIMAFGCSQEQTPISWDNSPARVANYMLPAGATLESAIFYVYVYEPGSLPVNFHRITSDWQEMVVTWASFGAAFDATVYNTTTFDAVGWFDIDLTDLVSEWIAGTDNFGFLMDQGEVNTPRTLYYSRESNDTPFMVIIYTMGETSVTDTIFPIADTYIYEFIPDRNFGNDTLIYTGWRGMTDLEKQALVKFDIEASPDEPELAAIGDYVWHDMDNDGIQDEGEPGVEGVTVNLYDCQDILLATTTTDANGFYLFDGLMAGDYYVEFVLPDGYFFSPVDQGNDDAQDSDADPMTGKAICTTLDEGEYDMTWDAGIYMPMQDGCTHTIGYWKTHAGFGPQADVVSQYLPIWLGDDGGSKSLAVTDAAIAVAVLEMKTYGTNSNGITKLYAQLLGAKLSIASGAGDIDVADIIADADAFLAGHDWNNWAGLSRADRNKVLYWQGMLDNYNNGLIGPGHCDELEYGN